MNVEIKKAKRKQTITLFVEKYEVNIDRERIIIIKQENTNTVDSQIFRNDKISCLEIFKIKEVIKYNPRRKI